MKLPKTSQYRTVDPKVEGSSPFGLSGTFFNHLRLGIYFKVTWQFGFKSHKLAGGWVAEGN